ERQRDLGADGGGVHVDDPGVDAVDGPQGGVDVAGVDRGRQAVLDAVDHGEGVVEVGCLEYGEHGTEHLVEGDGVVGLHAGEHRGAEEGAPVAAVDRDDLATRCHSGALV